MSGEQFCSEHTWSMADFEAQLEAERCAVMRAKEENQVLMGKLHEIVSRYKQLQKSQGDGVLRTRLETLEKEKDDLIGKLKTLVAKYRELQKQQSDNGDASALADRVQALELELAHEKMRNDGTDTSPLYDEVKKKEAEKVEVVTKLQEVVQRYRKLQQFVQETQATADASAARVTELEEALAAKDEVHRVALRDLEMSVTNQLMDAVKSKMDTINLLQDELEQAHANERSMHERQQELEAAVDKLNVEKASLKDEVASTLADKAARVTELEADFAALQAAHDASVQQHEADAALVQRDASVRDELATALEDKLQQLVTLQSALDDTVAANAASDDELTSLRDTNAALERRAESAEARIAALEAECATLLGAKNSAETALSEGQKSWVEAKAALDATVTSLEARIPDASSQLSDNLAQIEKDLAASLQQLEADHDALQQEKRALEGTLEVRQMTFEALQMQLQDIEATRATHEASQSQLHTEFRSLQASHEDLLDESSALRDAKTTLEADLMAATQLVASLQSQLADRDAALDDLRARQEVLLAEQARIEADKASLEAALRTHADRVSSLEAQLASAMSDGVASYEALKAAHDQVLVEKNELEDKLTSAEDVAVALAERSEALVQATNELKAVNARILALEAQVGEYDTARATLQASCNALLEEKAALTASLANTTAMYDDRLASLQAELAAALSTHSELDSTHAKTAALQMHLEAECSRLHEAYVTLEKDTHRDAKSFQVSLEAKATEIAGLQMQLQDALRTASALESLEAALTTLRAAHADVERDLAAKMTLVEDLEAKVADLDATNASLEVAQTEMAATLAQLKQEKSALEAEVSAKQSAIGRLEAKAAHLDEELTTAHETARAERKDAAVALAKLEADYEHALQAKADDDDGAKNELAALLREKAAHIAALESNLEGARTEVEDAKHDNDTLRDECTALRDASHAAEAAHNEKIQVLEADVATMTQKCSSFVGDLVDAKKQLRTARQTADAADTEHAKAVRVLEAEVASLQASLATSRSELDTALAAAAVNAVTARNELEARQIALEAEVSAKTEACATLEDALHVAQDDALVAALEADVAAKTGACLALEGTLAKTNAELQDALAELASSRMSFEATTAELDAMTASCAALRDGVQQAQDLVAKKTASLEAVQEKLASALSTNNDLTKQLAATTDQVDTLQQKVEDAKAEVATRQGDALERAQAAEASLEVATARHEEALAAQCYATEAVKEELTHKIGMLKAQVVQAKADLDAANAELEAAHSALDETTAALATAKTTSETFAASLDETQHSLQAATSECSDLSTQLARANDELAQVTASAREAEAKLLALHEAHDLKFSDHAVSTNELRDAVSALRSEKAVLAASIQDLEARVDKANAGLQAAMAAKEALQSELETATQDAERMEIACAALEADMATAQSTNESLEWQKSDLEDALWTLQKAHEALESEKTALVQQLSTVEGHASDLATASDALATLQASFDALSAEHTALQDTLSLTNTTVAALTDGIALRERSAAEASAAWTAEKEVLNARIETLEVNVHDKEAALRTLEDAVAASKAQCEAAVAQAESKAEGMERALAAAEDAKDTLAQSLKEKLEEVLRRYKKLQEQALDLKGRYDDKVVEATTASDALASLTTERDAITNRHALLADQHEALLQQERVQAAQVEALVEQEQAQSAEIEKLRAQIAALEAASSNMAAAHERSLVIASEASAGATEELTRLGALVAEKTRALNELSSQMVVLRVRCEELETTANSDATERAALTVRVTSLESAALMSEAALASSEARAKQVQAQLDVEIEAAGEAREALEGYKRRAHVALKKATVDSKTFNDERQSLQDEITALHATITDLRALNANERDDFGRQLAAADASRSELLQQMEASTRDLRDQIAALSAQADARASNHELQKAQWQAALDEQEAKTRVVRDANAMLESSIEGLKKEIQAKTDVAREMLKVKDTEIHQLMQSLSEAPPPAVPSVDAEILNLARIQASHEEEAARMRRQIVELEDRAGRVQKKYEDTRRQLESSQLQLARHEELGGGQSPTTNVEYLKNVLLKYFVAESAKEKEQLIPVLSTILHFSPAELRQIQDKHEAPTVLGSVFSYFGSTS